MPPFALELYIYGPNGGLFGDYPWTLTYSYLKSRMALPLPPPSDMVYSIQFGEVAIIAPLSAPGDLTTGPIDTTDLIQQVSQPS